MSLKVKKIHILHMNDLHSHFENIPKLVSYIKQQKEQARKKDEILIVVDIGDHMDRMRLETEGTAGRINVELLNESGVSVSTIGNNEGLTFTKEQLEDVYQHKNFRIVACNLFDNKSGFKPEWLETYWIENYEGIRIGWVGATAPYETFYSLQGWEIYEPLTLLEQTINMVKEQVDIIVVLSHLGIKADQQMAEMIPSIDAILGAHTHRFFENGLKEPNKPLICQVGIFGSHIGHLTMDYDLEEKRILDINEKTVNITDCLDDIQIVSTIEKYREIAIRKLSEPVTQINEQLRISIEKESRLGNLLADGVKNWVGADIGIINTGQILDSLEAGVVTKKRIHEICPSPINPCKLKLKGSLLKETLEEALLDEVIFSNPKGYGFRGKELGTLCISGIKVYYDPLAAPMNRIKDIWINDKEFRNEDEYLIGTLDMFTFGGGYTTMKQGTNIQYYLPEFIRDVLSAQLKNKEAIRQSYSQRWFKV